jgi:hypothetical protein
MPSHSILESHYQNPRLRQLPHYRTIWPGIRQSCNIFAGTKFLARRVTFLLVILMRTFVMLFFAIFLYLWDTSLLQLAPFIFWYVAWSVPILWNLHLIVESTRPREVLGRTIPGAVFTALLWLLLPVHLVFTLDMAGGIYRAAISCTIWLAIVAAVAWIAGGEVEEEEEEQADGSLSLA